MHTMMFTALAAGLAIAALARAADTTQPSTPPATQPNPPYHNAGYGLGFDLGKKLKETNMPFDADSVAQGIRDALAGNQAKVSDQDFHAAMQQIQQELVGQSAKADDDYRASNAKNPKVTTTPSGLQIETLAEGTGASPAATDTVKVDYTGMLIDGKVFDSSIQRGEPATFPVNGVIPGWTEALKTMKVGGKARLVIPPALGYGAGGFPPDIPPNATLVFEVHLLEIEKNK